MQIHVGIGLRIVKAGGDHSLPETQDSFDKTRDTCGRFRMAQIGFHRADQTGISG